MRRCAMEIGNKKKSKMKNAVTMIVIEVDKE